MIEMNDTMPPEFETYFKEKVKVVGYPKIEELHTGMYMHYEVVVNVCDE